VKHPGLSIAWPGAPIFRLKRPSFQAEGETVKSFLLVVVGMVLGGALSLLLASGTLTGLGAGAGIVTGLKAGACLTVEAAKDKGYVTSDQVNELLNAAAAQIAGEKLANEILLTGGDAACQKVVEELKQAAKDTT